MSVVYLSVAATGTSHTAVSSTPTAPIAATRVKLRPGRWVSQSTAAASTAKIATTRWLVSVAANNTAGSHRGPRRSSARASVPRKKSDNASAIMNEYSPANVLASVPPMMCRSKVCVASPPCLKNRNTVAATANRGAVGRGTRTPRANTYAPIGSNSGPTAVTSLNATL